MRTATSGPVWRRTRTPGIKHHDHPSLAASTAPPWHRLRRLSLAGLAGISIVLGSAAASAQQPDPGGQVDLELVLAVDVSGSMDHDEQLLQRSGYIEAIQHPDVVDAIGTGLIGRIAVTYMEWAGPLANRVVVPWRVIDGPETAVAFAGELSAAPVGTMRGTSISGGLSAAASLFGSSGFEAQRRVIDISGDGPNNMGPPVTPVRDEVLALGIIINGLPIMMKRRDYGYGTIQDLDEYYANCVIGGPGAFLVAVDDPNQLVAAIRRKLVLEIADAGGDLSYVQATPDADPNYDCGVGERQRREWFDR